MTRTTSYDAANRLASFAANLPALGNQTLLAVADNDPVGMHVATLGNGSGALTETRHHHDYRTWLDALSVVKSGTTLYSFGLAFDGNGNVTAANDNTNGNWAYSYDHLNRLQTASVTGHTLTYYPDQYGNMYCADSGNWPCTPVHGTPPTLPLTFNTSTNHITVTGYNYDAAGNLLSDTTHQYHYDAENHIDCVNTDVNGNCTPDSIYYLYDAAGKRVGKQQYNTLEDYVLDPQGHIISVHDNLGTRLRTELYVPGNPGRTPQFLFVLGLFGGSPNNRLDSSNPPAYDSGGESTRPGVRLTRAVEGEGIPMPRLARVVIADVAHHLTQRGNGRQFILASDSERRVFLDLLRQAVEGRELSLVGYCLMSNHLHLVVVPHRAEELAPALQSATGLTVVDLSWRGRTGAAPRGRL